MFFGYTMALLCLPSCLLFAWMWKVKYSFRWQKDFNLLDQTRTWIRVVIWLWYDLTSSFIWHKVPSILWIVEFCWFSANWNISNFTNIFKNISNSVQLIMSYAIKIYQEELQSDRNKNFHDMLFCVKQHESRYRAKLLLLLPIINTACKPLWTHREH